MIYTINNLITEQILVTDSEGTPITGLTNANFTKTLLKNKAVTVESITVTEKGNGFYYIEFTPLSTGFYEWLVTHVTYNTKGWWEYYNIGTNDVDDISTDLGAIETKIDNVKTVVDSNAIILNIHTDLLANILGLSQENYYLDNTVFNVNGAMTSGRIRTYSNSGSVGTTNNVLETYLITTTYDISGYVDTYSVVKQ